jgi:hypothetical protein
LYTVVAHIEDEEVGCVAAILEQYVQQTLLPQGLPIHIDLQVRVSYELSSSGNPDPDPAFYLSADPDPDPSQTLKSQKVEFLHEKI